MHLRATLAAVLILMLSVAAEAQRPRRPLERPLERLRQRLQESRQDEPATVTELRDLETALPREPRDFTPEATEAVRRAARALETWLAGEIAYAGLSQPDEFVQAAERMVAAKRQVDEMLDSTLAIRTRMIELPPGDARRSALRNFLAVTSELTDLSGRKRYLLFDGLYEAAFATAPHPASRDRLVAMLIRHGSSIGAVVMAEALFDPPPDNETGAKPATPATKGQLLELIAVTGQMDLLSLLAEFVSDPATPPELVLKAAETIRRVGLPQDSRPGQDPTLGEPPITARKLREELTDINSAGLDAASAVQREELLRWLQSRVESGITGDTYTLAGSEVQSGDWLLMRNPSPYNLFTDLSPGLFTHVGVITDVTDSDGLRRVVLVDLPELGKQMQVTNVDVFVQRTLDYVVLRHEDPAAATVMADIARTVSDNPTQFDLNFRTDRVEALRGQPLDDAEIHTYCAGLLLLCAQETGLERSDYFPIPEGPAGGKTVANLAELGLSFGRDFISPTGALYSPRMRIVARRDPMYEPGRHIEQVIYDHFSHRLIDADLKPSQDLFQSLRSKLAQAASGNPILARALASAAGVDEQTDLVAAAKAAAVVETLDEVARGASRGFRLAHEAIVAGPAEQLPQAGYSPEGIESVQRYRQRHQELFDRWQTGQIAPWPMRKELVDHYVRQGIAQLEARFFQAPTADDRQ